MGSTTELISGVNGARAIISTSRPSICLPSEEIALTLDDLYSAVCNSLRCSVKALADRAKNGEFYKIFLIFELNMNDGLLTLSQCIRVVTNGKALLESKSEKTFLILDNKCLKSVKNGKKQRNFPLWKMKNIRKKKSKRKNPTE